MSNKDMDMYEDLCIFLDENISKLVKLKVSTSTKFKEMDELYVNYLTAESIRDKERMSVFAEELEMCREWLRQKARKAIMENQELLANPLVRDYLRALGEPIKKEKDL